VISFRQRVAAVAHNEASLPQVPFRSELHDERVAALLGLALGVCFVTCFITGLLSHLIQQPPGWFHWPAQPAWGYRFTQGLHVATGTAAIPLLLAKLWVVLPKFYEIPPVRSIAHALERISLLPLVGGSLFMLFSGISDLSRYRPFGFNFTVGHFWVAWITIGGLITHIAAKVSVTRRALTSTRWTASLAAEPGSVPGPEGTADPSVEAPAGRGGLSRRGFIGSVVAASGVVTATTIGQTVRPLGFLNVLGPRKPHSGPQGVPVNKTAAGAGVTGDITEEKLVAYRLEVKGKVRRELSLSLDDLKAMPQYESQTAIACVEGWSSVARWRGVRMSDLLAKAGAAAGTSAQVESMQVGGIYSKSILEHGPARDGATLLALEVNGEPLHPDHGRPLRLIGPNRPGVQQTKWVHRVTVL